MSIADDSHPRQITVGIDADGNPVHVTVVSEELHRYWQEEPRLPGKSVLVLMDLIWRART